jgi:protein subunit release factor A
MVFKVKLEDKAALLNRMEKSGDEISSNQIKDNKAEGYFELTVTDPEQLKIVRSILNKSPKINTIKEMKKSLTKSELKEMIRQELSKKKNKLDETELNEALTGAEQDILNVLGYVAAASGIGVGAYIRNLFKKAGEKEAELAGKEPEEIKQAGKDALQDISNKLGKITGAGQ